MPPADPSLPDPPPREPAARAALAVGLALITPVLGVMLLPLFANWAYDRVDAGAPRSLATGVLLAALGLPWAPVVASFFITRSRIARGLAVGIGLLSTPLLLGYVFLRSWWHH